MVWPLIGSRPLLIVATTIKCLHLLNLYRYAKVNLPDKLPAVIGAF